jgi:hypothetical protein
MEFEKSSGCVFKDLGVEKPEVVMKREEIEKMVPSELGSMRGEDGNLYNKKRLRMKYIALIWQRRRIS